MGIAFERDKARVSIFGILKIDELLWEINIFPFKMHNLTRPHSC
jgi:hypothetical protein